MRACGKVFRWSVTLAWAVGIFYLSVISTGGEPLFPHFDKAAHFIMYAGLAFLLVWSLKTTSPGLWRRAPVIAVVSAFIYGAANEINQHFLPHRGLEAGDMAANALGAITGAFVAVRAARFIESRRQASALTGRNGGPCDMRS